MEIVSHGLQADRSNSSAAETDELPAMSGMEAS